MKYLIIGLGNIGEEYENTRHNIGFTVLDALAQDRSVTFSSDRYGAVANFHFKGRQFVMVKPSTYMNLSGKAVRYWMQKENVEAANILVVTDDIDLDLGTIRLRASGSGGSHNGLNHIIETLGNNEFPRLRFGIGKDYPRGMQVDYVLGKWSRSEEAIILKRIPIAVEAVISFAAQGVARTMNDFNKR
ncbi:MAG: aminoacyl-tRNA hydrolase [Bacteroidota bacterium]